MEDIECEHAYRFGPNVSYRCSLIPLLAFELVHADLEFCDAQKWPLRESGDLHGIRVHPKPALLCAGILLRHLIVMMHGWCILDLILSPFGFGEVFKHVIGVVNADPRSVTLRLVRTSSTSRIMVFIEAQ